MAVESLLLLAPSLGLGITAVATVIAAYVVVSCIAVRLRGGHCEG